MKRAFLAMAVCGALAGAILGIADGAAIAFGARDMFFDAGEMRRTAAMAIGMCAAASALLSCLVGGFLELWGTRARALEGGFPLRFVAALSVPIGALVGFALWRLTSGPQASGLPFRGGIVVLAAAIFAIALCSATIALIRFSRRSRAKCALSGALCLGAAGVLYAVDASVLVRLYPVFHIGLSLTAVFLLALGLRLQAPRRMGRLFAVAATVLVVVALSSGAVALNAVRDHANPRFVIGEKTAVAAKILLSAERVPGFLEKKSDGPAADAKALAGAEASAISRIARPGAPVVLISVDALRYDRVGRHATRENLTPNIDAFLRTAVVFDRAYTAIPHTSYAVTSLLSGKYIHALGDVPGAPEAHETLPEILRRFRYKSGGFFTKAVFFIDRARFEPYLRTGFGFDLAKIEYETPAKERVAQTIEFLEKQRADGKLAFTWTHFFEPHEPYDPACTRFGSSDEERYDCEIATVDEALSALFRYLDEKLEDAIVVFTADHGEEFGDHGGRYHGTTLYDEQVRVPLAFRVPGVEPRTVVEPVGLVDVAGTLLSLLELPVPARVRSRDLSPLMAGARDADHAAFTEVADSLMVERGDLKLVWDRATDIALLYDLAADPKETLSVAEKRPDAVQDLLAVARAFDASHAPIELRPVEAASGESSWPEAVRRGIAGDATSVEDLLALVGVQNPMPVRRKAAQLAAKLARGDVGAALSKASDRAADDPETSAWLGVARMALGDAAATDVLRSAIPKLPSESAVWRAAVLSLFGAAPDDKRAQADAIALAASESAPVEDRQVALGLFAAHGTRAAEKTAEAALSNYQLALDAAKALAALGSKRALPGLIARLARERFPERRAAVIEALLPFGDRRTISPIAAELAREEPVPSALPALVALRAKTDVTHPIRLSATNEALFLRAPGKDVLWCRLDAVRRVIVATRAKADGGTLRITCNNATAGEIPVTSGDAEGTADFTSCTATEKGLIAIRAVPEPEDLEVDVRAIAALGKR